MLPLDCCHACLAITLPVAAGNKRLAALAARFGRLLRAGLPAVDLRLLSFICRDDGMQEPGTHAAQGDKSKARTVTGCALSVLVIGTLFVGLRLATAGQLVIGHGRSPPFFAS